ncbi:hypothetical protein [Dactylosporangium sp. CA-092794]|uniref:hypothetical protein n=1 Tax=Dactylosporangium sp. CA-092794 TaxID=3239929 RepID=UPI003D90C023
MSIAPTSPVEQPEAPQPARVPIGREVLFALIAAVVVTALGAPLGLLWSRVAPQVELVQTQYGPYPIEPEPEGYWADDGWFILMSIGMGIILAVAAWLLLRRYRGPIVLAGLVVGSAAASVLGAWLGNKIGYAHYLDLAAHAPVDTHIFRPVKLRTGTSSLAFGFLPWVRGTMLIQALATAAVYTALAGFHASPTLRYETMPQDLLDPPPPTTPDQAHPDQAHPDASAPPRADAGPDTSTPQWDARPDASAPQWEARPDASAPRRDAQPDASVPQWDAGPDASAPWRGADSGSPVPGQPDASVPESSARESSAPGSSAPGYSPPGSSEPDSSAPGSAGQGPNGHSKPGSIWADPGVAQASDQPHS